MVVYVHSSVVHHFHGVMVENVEGVDGIALVLEVVGEFLVVDL